MSENKPTQYDPENEGPVISVIATASMLVRIAQTLQHVLDAHEVDDPGTGDLAHLSLTVSQIAAELAVFVLENTEGDENSMLIDLLKKEEPTDEEIWDGLAKVMSDDEIAAIQKQARGESGE
jgi:hypothetical protein